MTTLVAVVLNIVGFNTTTPINCLVSFLVHVLLVMLSDQPYYQGMGNFLSRKRPLNVPRLQ